MYQRSWKERLSSRKFLLPVINGLFVALNEFFGLPVSREAYPYITGSVATFVLVEGYVDAKAIKEFIINLMEFIDTEEENEEDVQKESEG